jgi:hypothetical protein
MGNSLFVVALHPIAIPAHEGQAVGHHRLLFGHAFRRAHEIKNGPKGPLLKTDF